MKMQTRRRVLARNPERQGRNVAFWSYYPCWARHNRRNGLYLVPIRRHV
jgi:hypothetical protein